MRLTHERGSNAYVTTDGRYSVEKVDDYETECGCVYCRNGTSSDCPRGGVTFYTRWVVWDYGHNDYAWFRGTGNSDPGPDGFDTKRDATAWLTGCLES